MHRSVRLVAKNLQHHVCEMVLTLHYGVLCSLCQVWSAKKYKWTATWEFYLYITWYFRNCSQLLDIVTVVTEATASNILHQVPFPVWYYVKDDSIHMTAERVSFHGSVTIRNGSVPAFFNNFLAFLGGSLNISVKQVVKKTTLILQNEMLSN